MWGGDMFIKFLGYKTAGILRAMGEWHDGDDAMAGLEQTVTHACVLASIGPRHVLSSLMCFLLLQVFPGDAIYRWIKKTRTAEVLECRLRLECPDILQYVHGRICKCGVGPLSSNACDVRKEMDMGTSLR